MLDSGLVSITFRDLNYQQIIDLVQKAGLKGIEWGGDIHVPHGDLQKAEKVSKATINAGLEIAAYGSYYRVGCEKGNIDCSFERVLKTADILQAPLIRVWAGDKGSKEANKEWWDKVIVKSREIASKAAKQNIKIAFEYHDGTLTDTDVSALKLLKEIDHPNIYTYWQPPHHLDVTERKTSLKKIISWLQNIHVFYWESRERHPLKKGYQDWKEYFQLLDNNSDKQHYLLMEFVENDDPQQFLEDAKILKKLIKEVK